MGACRRTGLPGLLLAVFALCGPHAFGAELHPEDFRDCTGSRTDHTDCWQQALDAAIREKGHRYFGAVTASAGKTYLIRNTLKITNAHGGVIDGRGAVLEWAGIDSKVPMFLLTNTQGLKITNLYIRSSPAAPLQAAFEFTKGTPVLVNPRYNVLDHVIIDGTDLNGLQYGVRFTARNGLDEDNDQSVIINSGIFNVTTASLSIEHSQSHDHRLIAVNGTGAPGNTSAAFVRADAGSFTSIDGFHGFFGLANYYLVGIGAGVTIINENSEESAALIKTPEGAASFPMPVQVIGGRFAVENLQANGRVIDFHRYGPLTIQGLIISGTVPKGAVPPTIHFWPAAANKIGGHAELNLASVSFLARQPGRGTNTYDPVVVSPIARVTSVANSCLSAEGVVASCVGRAAGVSPWVDFADLQVLTVPGQAFYCRDCGRRQADGACLAGGDGHFARRLPRGWVCD